MQASIPAPDDPDGAGDAFGAAGVPVVAAGGGGGTGTAAEPSIVPPPGGVLPLNVCVTCSHLPLVNTYMS